MAHTEHDHDHGHGFTAENYVLPAEAWSRARNGILFVALISWIALAAGYAMDQSAFFHSYLIAFAYGTSIAIGSFFYVMVQHITGSAWSVTVRRLMENLMKTLPVTLILFLPLAFGVPHIYHWAQPEAAHDPILQEKASYLNQTWFLIRGLLVLGLMSLWATSLYRASRAQDTTGSIEQTRTAKKWSASGIVLVFVGGSVMAYDWIMSLDPHWYSTMFGVIFLAGGAMAFMATLILICLALRANGYLVRSVNVEHYHDLGKWLFALTVFWAYTSFSQYMLMWYGNLPEEIVWFKERTHGGWLIVSFVLLIGHFIFPFFSLMPRASKRSFKILGFFAAWMLLMHLVDLSWQIIPAYGEHGGFSWITIAAILAVTSTMGLVFWSGFREKPLVPVGDPRLDQCLAFHNS